MDKKRPGGEFGKRLKDRFMENYEIHRKKLVLQAFFTLQGTIAKAQCECGVYLHKRAYWIGYRGPLCYSCYLRGDKK